MKLCEYDCIPCCDCCKFVKYDIEDDTLLDCNLHLDQDHQELAEACSYCDDFVCINAEDE